MNFRQRYLSLLLSVVIVSQVACGGGALVAFRLTLASSGPLINSLVASGALPPSLANDVHKDFTDGVQVAVDLQAEFKAAGVDRGKRLTAAQKAERAWKAIVDRHHFAANARLQQVAAIADGVLSSLVLYYSSESQGVIAGPALSDKQIERQLKPKVEALKQAMQP